MSAERQARNGAIDYLRFFLAMCIVYFHMGQPFGNVALSALHIFVALTVYYGFGRPPLALAHRLLRPWLLWSAVYALLHIVDLWVSTQPFGSYFAPWMLLTGSSLHLWYFPFCALLLGIAALIPAGVLIPLLVAIFLVCQPPILQHALGIPFDQWVTVLPSAALGLVLRYARSRFGILLICALSALVFAALGGVLDWAGALQNSIAAVVLATGLCVPISDSKRSKWCSDMALGLYILHPIFISITAGIGVAGGVFGVIVVIVVSTFAAHGLRRVLPAGLI